MKTRFLMILLLAVTSFMTNVLAQEVSIPDPGLNAAIRQTLGKPAGLLTAQDLLSLTSLDAADRGVSSLEGLGAAHNLTTLNLHNNGLNNLTLPADLTNLTTLVLYNNRLTSLTLPAGLASLTTLDLRYSELTSLTLPAGLASLTTLWLYYNQLSSLTLPTDLTSLTDLDLGFNQLTSLTLPADLTSLSTLNLDDNPLLQTFVLSEPLAATRLADQVASLRGEGVSVYVYPVAVSLVSGQRTIAGAFEFTLTGPPGAYTIMGSANLAAWSELGTLTNEIGTAVFTDLTVTNSLQNFYRARTTR
jgi:hypothetical protein